MMKIDIERAQVEWLARQEEAVIRDFLARMSVVELARWDAHFESWSDPGQYPPEGEGWNVWLLMAGRGYGKTRAGSQWVHRLARRAKVRIALVGATIAEARGIMVEGAAGLIAAAAADGIRLEWEPSNGRLRWPGGGEARVFSGDSPEGLRGFEHDFAWCDEFAKWSEPEAAWHNLQFGLRHGRRPRAMITTTPRPMAFLRQLAAMPRTVVSGGRTTDNLSLDAQFLDMLTETYGGTRIGRQEMEGELLGEAEGSLFPRALIERCRTAPPEQFERVVVAVDPPAGAGPTSDACGIVVAGRAAGKVYVLADASVSGMRPEGWARSVAGAARSWNASHVIAEANQGGEMVKSVLEAADAGMRVHLVHATSGKSARAEPVAVRFAAGKAFFAGVFRELEAELSGLVAGGGYDGPSRSPDRADAMVWAVRELSEMKNGLPRVRML